MANRALADVFDEIADLLDISGAESFRVNSYRRAARTIRTLTRDVADLAAEGKLAELPGIGKAMQQKIGQYLVTGTVDLREELLREVPGTLLQLLEIPGMGPKKVAHLWRDLGVTTMEELKAAIADGRVAGLKGMGAKTVAHIREGIAFLEKSAGRTPLGLAWPLAQELVEAVRGLKSVGRAEIAGSLRRGAETSGDIDLVCASPAGAAVVEAFTKLPQVLRVTAQGDTKGSVVLSRRDGAEIAAQLRVVPAESFGAAWQYFTGSKEHNVRLREMATKRKWKLNEWGLYSGQRRVAGAEEEEIYAKLGLPLIPPELREDRGEFDLKKGVPRLIERGDIRGDFHMHTTASDGTLTAAEMARAAADLGYEYIAIADHSKSSTIANGLSIDRMWRQIEQIRQLNATLDTISVLVACECDILADGSLDYPDSILAACDLVVASVHAGLGKDSQLNTRRVLRAMENRFVTIIGHPTGRLLSRREPMELDMEAVTAAAARTHTALELNAAWQRLDLHDRHVRMARDAGVMIAIDTDAHSAAQLQQMELGIKTARRGWLTAADVLNTRPLPLVKKWIARKRQQGSDA